jgi:hypothetical protein
MILSLNPEQFLAIYNSVNTNSSLTAQEIKSKMDLILLDALSLINDSKNQSRLDNWMKQEKGKVENLESELKSIRNLVPFDDGLSFPHSAIERNV